MASDKGIYDACNEIRCEVADLRSRLSEGLEELAAAAECVNAHQLYTAHVLGALVGLIHHPSDVNQLAEEAIQERLCTLAYNLAHRMCVHEIKRLKAVEVDRNGDSK